MWLRGAWAPEEDGRDRKMRMDTEARWKTAEGKPEPMGLCRRGKEVNVCVCAPAEESCTLNLYRAGEAEPEARLPFSQEQRFGNLCFLKLVDCPEGQYEYTFTIGGQEVCDPYARRVAGREAYGCVPSYVRGCFPAEEDSYDWEGDVRPEIPYEDLILYGLHVRGFTMDATSRAEHRGTFRGVAEKIPYLKELGVNGIELMPAYEFPDLVPNPVSAMAHFVRSERLEHNYKRNFWGYGPGNYFAPKAGYAAGDDPVREFRDMVKELHRNGMEVIMEFYFPDRTDAGLILDVLRYWVRSFHIDGAHVSGYGLPVQLIARDPFLAGIKLLANSFPLQEIYEAGYVPSRKNLAEYNDGFQVDMRRFLRGDDGQVGAFAYRLRKNPSQEAVVNYAAGHNGFTLMDMVSYEVKHNEDNREDNRDGTDYNYSFNCGEEGRSRKKKVNDLRARQMRNALLAVFLSQGVPALMAGDECCNSQNGNNNPYCLDDGISWVNWSVSRAAGEMRAFVRELIAFRRGHRAFCQREELRGTDYRASGFPDISYHGKNVWYPQMDGSCRQLGVMYSYMPEGEAQPEYYYVAYNMYGEAQEFALPNLPKGYAWHTKIDSGRTEGSCFFPDGEEPLLAEQKALQVRDKTVMVLQGMRQEGQPG